MAKKKYEKPQLKGEKLFEAGAIVGCCKVTASACSKTLQTGNTKDTRTSSTS